MNRNFRIEKLTAGETIVVKANGRSMEPLIKNHQRYELTPCTWEDAEVGDAVYCKVKGNYYTHYVKGKDAQRGLLISNYRLRENGWTKAVYGKVTKILER